MSGFQVDVNEGSPMAIPEMESGTVLNTSLEEEESSDHWVSVRAKGKGKKIVIHQDDTKRHDDHYQPPPDVPMGWTVQSCSSDGLEQCNITASGYKKITAHVAEKRVMEPRTCSDESSEDKWTRVYGDPDEEADFCDRSNMKSLAPAKLSKKRPSTEAMSSFITPEKQFKRGCETDDRLEKFKIINGPNTHFEYIHRNKQTYLMAVTRVDETCTDGDLLNHGTVDRPPPNDACCQPDVDEGLVPTTAKEVMDEDMAPLDLSMKSKRDDEVGGQFVAQQEGMEVIPGDHKVKEDMECIGLEVEEVRTCTAEGQGGISISTATNSAAAQQHLKKENEVQDFVVKAYLFLAERKGVNIANDYLKGAQMLMAQSVNSLNQPIARATRDTPQTVQSSVSDCILPCRPKKDDGVACRSTGSVVAQSVLEPSQPEGGYGIPMALLQDTEVVTQSGQLYESGHDRIVSRLQSKILKKNPSGS